MKKLKNLVTKISNYFTNIKAYYHGALILLGLISFHIIPFWGGWIYLMGLIPILYFSGKKVKLRGTKEDS
jgi:hypothetical protein